VDAPKPPGGALFWRNAGKHHLANYELKPETAIDGSWRRMAYAPLEYGYKEEEDIFAQNLYLKISVEEFLNFASHKNQCSRVNFSSVFWCNYWIFLKILSGRFQGHSIDNIYRKTFKNI
jgi:hypothetical protein